MGGDRVKTFFIFLILACASSDRHSSPSSPRCRLTFPEIPEAREPALGGRKTEQHVVAAVRGICAQRQEQQGGAVAVLPMFRICRPLRQGACRAIKLISSNSPCSKVQVPLNALSSGPTTERRSIVPRSTSTTASSRTGMYCHWAMGEGDEKTRRHVPVSEAGKPAGGLGTVNSDGFCLS